MEAWEANGGDRRPALATTAWRAPTVEGLAASRPEKRSGGAPAFAGAPVFAARLR